MPDLKDLTLVITGKEKESDLMDYEMDGKVKEKCMGMMEDMKAMIAKEGMDPKEVIMSMLDGKSESEEAPEMEMEEDMGDKEAKKKMLVMALKKGE